MLQVLSRIEKLVKKFTQTQAESYLMEAWIWLNKFVESVLVWNWCKVYCTELFNGFHKLSLEKCFRCSLLNVFISYSTTLIWLRRKWKLLMTILWYYSSQIWTYYITVCMNILVCSFCLVPLWLSFLALIHY